MEFIFIQNNLAFVYFTLCILAYIYFKRDKLELQGKYPWFYILMYKTKLGLNKMKDWSHNKPKIFLFLAYLSIFVGITGLIFSSLLMIYQLKLIVDMNLTQGAGLVLPIQTQSGTLGGIPVFAPPFFEWLVALIILVIVHEFAHGVIAQRFNIKIKSSGFAFMGTMSIVLLFTFIGLFVGAAFENGTLLSFETFKTIIIAILIGLIPIFPAAFVEPDEKELQKTVWWKQIAVYGAGSTSNFIFGFLFLFLFIGVGFMISPILHVQSITFTQVDNQSGLYDYNITEGEIIGLNQITDKEVIYNQMLNLSVNQTLNLTVLSNNQTQQVMITTLKGIQDDEKGRIGITLDTSKLLAPTSGKEIEYMVLSKIEKVLYWVWLLNIAIGIMNLLPLWITDGGQITRTLLLEKFKKDTAYKWLNRISFFMLILIFLMMFPNVLKLMVSWF